MISAELGNAVGSVDLGPREIKFILRHVEVRCLLDIQREQLSSQIHESRVWKRGLERRSR